MQNKQSSASVYVDMVSLVHGVTTECVTGGISECPGVAPLPSFANL